MRSSTPIICGESPARLGGEQEGDYAAALVDGQVSLGEPATPGAAQRMVVGFSGNEIHAVPPGPGGVYVRPGSGRVHSRRPGQLALRVRGADQRGLDPFPHPQPC
jgi:hypothetical protein